MPTRKLPNYVRASRMGLGLSQQDLSRLLGCQSGAKVSRYEHFTREPTLMAALKLVAALDMDIRELFAGMYQQAQEEVYRNAQQQLRELDSEIPESHSARKKKNLRNIVNLNKRH